MMTSIRATRSPLRAAAALLLMGVWGCESAGAIAASGDVRAEEVRLASTSEVDVHQGTLNWLFANKGATGMDAYCVSTGHPDADNDPSADLLSRFAGSATPVVALSSCTISVGGDTYNPTGGPAQWFFLGAATISGQRAELDAGFHINGRLSERFHCTLRLSGGSWVVRNCVLTAAA